MSIRQQAAEIKQKQAAAAEDAATERRKKIREVLTRKISSYTGIPAVYKGGSDVAYEGYGEKPYYGGTSSRIVKVHKGVWTFLVDDVLVGAMHDESSGGGGGDPEKMKWKWFFIFEDPQHGKFKHDYDRLEFWSEEREDSGQTQGAVTTPEERTEAFVTKVVQAGNPDHPAVKLAKAGESCPTCHRGWDRYGYDD